MCVSVFEREWERGWERESERVIERMWERECTREREREWECVFARQYAGNEDEIMLPQNLTLFTLYEQCWQITTTTTTTTAWLCLPKVRVSVCEKWDELFFSDEVKQTKMIEKISKFDQ